jgi:hypothetical protein
MDDGLPFSINGRRADYRGIQVYAPGSELLYRSWDMSRWAAVQVRLDHLHATTHMQGVRLRLPAHGMVHQPVPLGHLTAVQRHRSLHRRRPAGGVRTAPGTHRLGCPPAPPAGPGPRRPGLARGPSLVGRPHPVGVVRARGDA